MPKFPDNPSIFFPDFELSLRRYGMSSDYYRFCMLDEGTPAKSSKKDPAFNRQFKQALQSNYEIIRSLKLNKDTPRIPRKIHQIWLGSPLPEDLKLAVSTWQNWEGWEYKLWTDEDLSHIQLRNRKLFDSLSNFGEKSDLLRYEILSQQGGLYLDVDCICLNPSFFELAHLNFDFYAGLEPLENTRYRISCCNALFGCSPKHPIIEALNDSLEANIAEVPDKYNTWWRTGPIYFTNIIAKHLLAGAKVNIIFPPTVFYPISQREIKDPPPKINTLIKPESVSIHLWERGWKKKPTN